jgi:6-phosphogluconolactonase
MLKAMWKDERRELIVPGDDTHTLTFCVDQFVTLCAAAIRDHGHFFVALSGGSTPKAIFQRLTTAPYASKIDWSKVVLFWSDERSSPPEDPESNYHMAMEAGFKRVPIPASQIHRMRAETDIEKHAEEYELLIKQIVGNRGFDLVMLGMGEDGHTASLFPDTKALHTKNRLVVANWVPQKNTWRMTMTFDAIHQSKHIVFYVLGAGKKEMLAKVLAKDAPYPASHIGTPTHPAQWIADSAAAASFL